MHKQRREFSPPLLPLETTFLKWISHMTVPPVNLADIKARMRIISEEFDKSIERKAKGPEFVSFSKPGKYIVRVLPSRNYPVDVQWFRKLDRYFIINVVTPDKQNVVQTAKVPQAFIKFLRTFQDMVNQLFCDPQHGNLIAFEAVPAANGFGNEYKILRQQPTPTGFSGEQIPDLDELQKSAIDDMNMKPTSAFTVNLAALFAAPAPPPTADPFAAFALALPAAAAPAANDAPSAGPFVQAPAPAPVATPTSICGISDAEAAALKAKLLAMTAGDKTRDKTQALRPVRP